MKKAIALIMVLVMLLTLFLPTVSATEKAAAIDLKKAIEIVKSNFSINSTNMSFSGNFIESPDGAKTWNLIWNSKVESGESYSANVNADTGEVLIYNHWNSTKSKYPRMPKYSKAEAFNKAQLLIEKLSPDKIKQTKQDVNSSENIVPYNSSGYVFTFIRLVNNIPFVDNGITVTIDKNTLEILNYSITWDINDIPDSSKVLSTEAAKMIMVDKSGMELQYNIYYKYTDSEPSVNLVYALKNQPISVIDAITGEKLTNTAESADKIEIPVPIVNSSEEQNAVSNIGNFLPKEKAVEIVEKYVKIEKKYNLSNSILYSGSLPGEAYWNISWGYKDPATSHNNFINAGVNAVSGELTGFYISDSVYSNPQNEKPVYSDKECQKIAIEFAKKIQPDKFADTIASDSSDIFDSNVNQPNRYFSFLRTENKILCPSDYIDFTVNAYTGEVTSYNYNWSNVIFPTSKNLISMESAISNIFDLSDFSLKYIKQNNDNMSSLPKIMLVYSLNDFYGFIDAKSGKNIDFSGKEIAKEIQGTTFADIEKSKYYDDIQQLTDMGIIEKDSNKYEPNNRILQKDFIKMLIKSIEPTNASDYNDSDYIGSDTEAGTDIDTDSYVDSDENQYIEEDVETDNTDNDSYYQQAIQKNIITLSEKKTDSNITRLDAAKLIIKTLNLEYLATIDGLYRVPFKDADKIAQLDKGYAVLAVRLEIIKTIDKLFKPSVKITKAEAASFIANYLRIDTGK